MWSSSEIVTVIIRSDHLFCIWLQHSKKDSLSFCMRAYEVHRTDFIYTNKTSLLNSTYLNGCIQNFLQKHSLKNPFVLLGLSSDALYENYYRVERESIVMNMFQVENKSLVWNYCVLDHTNETKDVLVYVYGLSRSQILHYQLAALRAPFNCIFITSVQRALLNLLWTVRGIKSSAEVVSGERLDFRHRLKSFLELLENRKDTHEGYAYSEYEVESLCASMGLYLLGENYESI